MTIDRQGRALAAVVAATLLAAAGNHLALTGGYGLSGVAAATSLSYLVYYLITVAISIWHDLDTAGRLRYLGMMALTHLPPVGLAVVLERLWPGRAGPGPIVAVKIAAVLAAWLLCRLDRLAPRPMGPVAGATSDSRDYERIAVTKSLLGFAEQNR